VGKKDESQFTRLNSQPGSKLYLLCDLCVTAHDNQLGLNASPSNSPVKFRLVYKLKFDYQPGSLTVQVAGEHQPYRKHP